VDRLSEHARRLDVRDVTLRLPANDLPTELDGLVVSLNEALTRLQRAYEQLNAFNADVAHELRTPLGNLIGETQVTLSRARTTEEMEATLQSNLEELERLRNIVNSMLFLARADRGETARDLVEVSLNEATTHAAEFMEMLMEDAGLELRIRGDARACVEQSLYARAITNLLDNALRHGAAGSAVDVDIAEGPDAVTVTVRNQAAPIPPEKLAHLFDRFYRADPSRTGSDQSHGLGLAIVKAVAQLHGGSVFAQSRGGEVAIGLRLPRVTPAQSLARVDKPGRAGREPAQLPQPSH
jgi:two-component system heavy metal sensor histidine kinase CusS